MQNQNYRRIWQTVLQIPSGKVASYGQIADLAGLPGRARLVGKALGYAPEELAVPWYRVLRSDRSLAFTPGSASAEEQRHRLLSEGVLLINYRVQAQYLWQPDLAELLFKLQY
ncbi:MGMT family protein [Rheinheimera maricola]|uniref:MGMT family protein n=1 Tax=Rheinheimera maricola TaxID=2793282 RepID=A0ABS7XAS3_9GAMM|nr:MGMT family protein [Rheinheimera maricola]MBZ9612668.1 MGMT family protein [Rheinheimera maricola]